MKNNPESGDVAMASKLMSHYGDDVFANILVTASSLERTKDKAKRLEEGLLTNWLATERSVDDVFTLLKMNEKGDEVFKSPVWGMWTSYLKKLGSENSDQLMFMVLRKHYDDDQLANILATTAKNYNTRGIAEKLEELQRASWLSSGKSADDVFHILKLNHEGDNLLKSQVLGSWVSYVKLLEKDPYEMLLFKLAKRYDAEALAIWLRAARDDYRSRSIATGIAEAQQKGWQKNGNSADDVFTLLKLDVEDALFLKSPVLDTWTSYVTKLKKDPNQLMFLKLETRYDDEGVAKVLLATKNDYTTRNAATTLENLLFQKWMSKDNSADGIFALLRLNKEGDKLFENPVFTTWESYVAKLDKANPDEAMFSVLKTHYSDQGLVKLVEIAKTNRRTENIAAKLQEEIWRNQGKTADDIFDLLKLNEKRGEMFATPEFTTWVAFVTKLNKLSKSPDEFPAISALTKRFGDVELARMLGRSKQDALRNKDLLKMVSDLQTQQFKQWHGQGKTPDDVSSMVMANGFDAKKDTRLWVILDTNKSSMEQTVTAALAATLRGLDETILEYLSGAVADQLADDVPSDAAALESLLEESVAPFLLSTSFCEDEAAASTLCAALAAKLLDSPELQAQLGAGPAQAVRVLETTQSIEEQARKDEGAADAEQLMARMWGFDKIRRTTNDELEAQQSALSARQVRKQIKLEQLTAERDEEQAELDREWEDARFLPDLTQDTGERDVHVPRLSINFKGKTLLSDTALKIVAGRRYGLVGKNGAGKTTLLRYISHYELEGFPRHIRIQLVEQESASKLSKDDRSVLEVVLAADYERTMLLQEEKELTADEANNGADHSTRLKEIYDRLVDIDSDTAESRARTILSGLQFPDHVVDGPAKALSGGWRMRTALAGALFMAPDLLLLDEPTNHLDLEAVIWLEHYLDKYEKQMIVVSHDRNFLNAVTTDIIHLTNQKLVYYKGDYNTFEHTMKENMRQQRKAYDAQQMKIQHMQEFIERFRANAKKAPLVQSRVKALDKILRNELIDEPEDEHAFRMHFPPAEPLGRPIIAVEDVGFRYTPESPLLFKDVHIGVDMSSRIGILGVNGSGKSTLINIMIGKLRANEGSVTMNPRLRVATFTQHHVDSLDLSKSAVQNMKEMFPGHEPDEFRSHLGRFNLSGELAIKPT
ncbi:ABCF/EF-3b transporter-like protein, partial [Phytophthora palmivora]